jgi:thiamine pyrophosphate-dependent acetolactate synthase large subunit-like protein
MTTAAYLGLSEYPVEGPGRFIHPVGFGTLGLALPAAIGAAVIEPDVPAVVLAGDGGFQFTLPEFAVAVQEKLRLPVVVFNDGGFGEISRNEELRHPGRKIAVEQENPDFAALARTYGAGGAVVTDPEELVSALGKALEARGPYLIEYRVSRS